MSSLICRAETDTGSAHNLIFNYPLNDNWFISSRNQLTSRDGFDDFFFGYLDANIGYVLGNGWSAEAGYRHAWLKLGDDWREEYRPSAILNYRTKLGEWSFSNRHRLEYRMFENTSNSQDRWRYRNETRFIAPWEIGPCDARLFIEEEFFYEFTDEQFNFNWLTWGLRWKLNEETTFKVGHRWQASKFDDEWNHRHQVVFGLLFFF
ncbi:DUF2490 domain-containing protein [Akkermansiaceae bacterium]|nr:DUF2490 domain-containing protein [Akkermansiaceae bacterium]MDA7888139.1 DUF2490 domain-containing protein [Akkermansiaceae bacterium]